MIESIGEETFNFQDERFADIQMLRYRLLDFESLTIRQKQLIYCLSEATLFGRDITFDQFGKYNLCIRKTLEAVYLNYNGDRLENNFRALEEYLKHVWFASGIYHHYACDKFLPLFMLVINFLPVFLKIFSAMLFQLLMLNCSLLEKESLLIHYLMKSVQ